MSNRPEAISVTFKLGSRKFRTKYIIFADGRMMMSYPAEFRGGWDRGTPAERAKLDALDATARRLGKAWLARLPLTAAEKRRRNPGSRR